MFNGYTPTPPVEAASRGRWTATSTTSASATWPRSWPRHPARPPRPTRAATRRSRRTSWSRARNYVTLFDPGVGFFQGRDADGAWRSLASAFDPQRVGQRLHRDQRAGTARSPSPQDGAGLAALYGGQDGLEEKLDAFFGTPETADAPRRRTAAPSTRCSRPATSGWASRHSNQPSHHIPYMYDYAGRPAKTQAAGPRDPAAAVHRQRDRPGLPGRRGQRRDVVLVRLQRAGLLPAAGRHRQRTRSARRCSPRPPSTWTAASSIVVNAPNNSAQNVYVQS